MNTQLENLISQRNINNIYKQPDEINQINIIDYKESDKRDKIGEKKEVISNTYREFLNMRKLSSKIYIDNIKK